MLAMLGSTDVGIVLIAAVAGLAPVWALASGLVARLKHRSVGTWLLAGFVAGPIALVVIACLPQGSERATHDPVPGPSRAPLV